MTLPKYIVLEKINNTKIAHECDCCGRDIIHVNYIKDTETGETLHLGTTCTKNYTGKSLNDINVENGAYEKAQKAQYEAEEFESQKKTFVQTFKEVDSAMFDYIENNQDNSFLKAMKERIEETGTLSKNMYAVIYSMMLPVAQLTPKVKDLEFKAIRFKKAEGHFGMTYTLFGETDNGELIRVFFSSMNERHNEIMLGEKIYDGEGFVYDNILDRDVRFTVSGSFDGYKIKRAKLVA